MTTLTAPLDPTDLFLLDSLGFKPTGIEQEAIVACLKRFILVAGGDQSGKSTVAAKTFDKRFTDTDGPGLYWLVAADYERTRSEFDKIAEDMTMLGLLKDVSKRVDPGYIVLHDGTRIETKSAKDPRTLSMYAPDGIIICEASQVDFDTYMRCTARVAPKRAWLFMSGTFEGSFGWYPQLFKAWKSGADPNAQAFSLPSPTNIHFYPGGINDPEIQRLKRESSDDFFMERIMGIPSPPKGVVFPDFRPDIHVKDIKFDLERDVYVAVDPGYADAASVLAIQVVNDRIHVFDEVYERGKTTEEIIDIVRGRDWFKNIHPGGSVIDLAGYQHQAQSAPAEIWLAQPPQGIGLYLTAHHVQNVNDLDERLKAFLKPDPINGEPKVVFSPKCKGALSELGAVPNPFDGQTHVYTWKRDREGNVVGQTPDNKHNHSIRALEYFIIDRWGYAHVARDQVIKVSRW